MAEETKSPEPGYPQSGTGKLPGTLSDRRSQPEGVVPKQSQADVIAGLAVLILLAVMFSKGHPKPAARATTPVATPPAAWPRALLLLQPAWDTPSRTSPPKESAPQPRR